ncbi:hypothetical protein GALMADRAFT_234197 [Galerina marginata CBS 339.88]|uniref:Chromatin remodeling factor mit1 n=1 Tax=Galerina marginata (strain CBS 339.88) TaxID=685588 RepID=A0A067TSS5_GALM3|nr:hypothetical protein GALMADRAFT_234197 [Galerina marginata CBS 339.88]
MSDSPRDFDRESSLAESRTSSKPPKVILKLPRAPVKPSHNFFVAPPRLPSAQKRQYKPAYESSLNLGLQTRVDKVIGEFKDGNKHYYYAQYDGGIAHKFPAESFIEQHPELVKRYKKALSDGTLPAFDPSAHYVHPLSRAKVEKPGGYSKSTRSEDEEVVPDSEEEETDENEDDEDYDGPSSRKQPQRNARSKNKELPFSPRKSRSHKVITINSDSDLTEESEEEVQIHSRRSTRTRKATEIHIDSDEDEYIDDDDYDDTRAKRKTKGTIKGRRRVKSVQPMYGHFRSIDTLDDDPFSDDEDNEALRNHRGICEKCHLGPAHKLLANFKKKNKGKGKRRKRSTDDEFEESEGEQTFIDLGGWVQCLKCPVSAHWKCLAGTQRDEVLKAVRERDREQWEAGQNHEGTILPKKRSQLDINQTTEFVCGACMRGGICMGCMETALAPDASRVKVDDSVHPEDGADVVMKDGTASSAEELHEPVRSLARELLFRCFTCKRLAHYRHLPVPAALDDDSAVADVAEHYQQAKSWLCADCSSYKYGLDKIIAWRPYPDNVVEPSRTSNEAPNYKTPLPREYLVKWAGKSYRRLEWVPHMWLLSTHPSKLKNFVSGGTKVELLQQPYESDEDGMEVDSRAPGRLFEKDLESRASSVKPTDIATVSPISPMPDAERRIPKSWKQVGRVLDILLWRPQAKKQTKRRIHKKAVNSSDEESSEDGRKKRVSALVFDKGEQPPDEFTESVEEWELHGTLSKSDIDQVVWAFIKWDELGYDEATWDSPPRPGQAGYKFFQKAFDKFMESRSVVVPKRTNKYWEAFDNRNAEDYRKHVLKEASDLALGQDPKDKLMPFQVDGFNWLCNNWWNHQHCILADEMGLGKTVQIVSFLGNIAKNWNAFPALVVVPNSTITNWVREFERWAPRLRVVPFYGEKNARDVIKKFELFHERSSSDNTHAKFHVLVTTYEALINGKDFTPVFKNQPRWEVLVVDEGQRLKSDSSLLFKKLNELKSIHRIIMTGTPLNNNMRELFNLMNFLDPREWQDLEGLEKQHEVLDEELVKQLHNRLRPYFLRRIKSEVLDLPPKNEVIVPISMAPLQREVYRSILSNNLNILTGLKQPSAGQNAPPKTRINNVLMQLRKCLQHPYLYAEDIEPRDLLPQETHDKLIDASGKLRFLKALLPKLKEHGHRVLLFSQFVIALNIVEDFLQGEGYKFLRLDGNTKGSDRQKAMDDFNKPNSEYFIFLLTTRAGGVGINLFTADTVIIFDPDFNPHQDLQAIARAYRYGQKKTCLVFKLMVKDSAEERIMQIGKKKLVLDHLIVQKMDDDEDNGGENVQSILTYGAQALFESEQETRDIVYTDNDIEKLLEKTEKEAVKEAPKAAGGLTFAFAKIWAADKDSLEDVVEDDQTDSWAKALEKINTEREKEQKNEIAMSGRGARRKAADIAKTKIHVGSGGSEDFNGKGKQKAKSAASDGSAYFGSDGEATDDISDSDNGMADEDFKMDVDTNRNRTKPKQELKDVQPDVSVDCGLCGQRHGPGQCQMVDKSENLAEYREMLILHADDEPWEERSAAIQAIDEILHQRGHISLIAGQPLHPVPKLAPLVPGQQNQPQIAGSSNPSPSLQQKNPAKKKARVVPTSPCVLCDQTPHLMKDCPIVLAGSKSISNHIRNLEAKNDPSMKNTLDSLRNLLRKAKAHELATTVPPS